MPLRTDAAGNTIRTPGIVYVVDAIVTVIGMGIVHVVLIAITNCGSEIAVTLLRRSSTTSKTRLLPKDRVGDAEMVGSGGEEG